ncbi:hypothetical protein BJ546DRAFT_998042 [Cryomyces antarcticus]
MLAEQSPKAKNHRHGVNVSQYLGVDSDPDFYKSTASVETQRGSRTSKHLTESKIASTEAMAGLPHPNELDISKLELSKKKGAEKSTLSLPAKMQNPRAYFPTEESSNTATSPKKKENVPLTKTPTKKQNVSFATGNESPFPSRPRAAAGGESPIHPRPADPIEPHALTSGAAPQQEYSYRPGPTPPFPAIWTAQHDRCLCTLDVMDYPLDHMVGKMKRSFPELGPVGLSTEMLDKRLRILDQISDCTYFKDALARLDEQQRNTNAAEGEGGDSE